jgi:hypothetical protein
MRAFVRSGLDSRERRVEVKNHRSTKRKKAIRMGDDDPQPPPEPKKARVVATRPAGPSLTRHQAATAAKNCRSTI